jgi:hypothetical protein
MEVTVMQTLLKDALYNTRDDSGASDDYARGLVVGVVSTLMAREEMTFEQAMLVVVENLPRGFNPMKLPESFRKDLPFRVDVPKIPVNSIVIPEEFVRVSSRWYSCMDDLLYAVSSTGGLTTGTNCPVTDYDAYEDKMQKWYYSIWLELSVDVGYAVSAAEHAYKSAVDYEDHEAESYKEDWITLSEFEAWVDEQIDRLALSYGLSDWEGV